MVGETEPTPSKIKNWLLRHSLSGETAQGVVDRLIGFHNLRIRNIPMKDTILGVTGLDTHEAHGAGSPHLALYLLWPTPLGLDSLAQSKQAIRLGKEFSERVSIPLRPDVSFRLEFVSPDNIPPSSFEDVLRRGCTTRNHTAYLGVIRH